MRKVEKLIQKLIESEAPEDMNWGDEIGYTLPLAADVYRAVWDYGQKVGIHVDWDDYDSSYNSLKDLIDDESMSVKSHWLNSPSERGVRVIRLVDCSDWPGGPVGEINNIFEEGVWENLNFEMSYYQVLQATGHISLSGIYEMGFLSVFKRAIKDALMLTYPDMLPPKDEWEVAFKWDVNDPMVYLVMLMED